MTVKLKLFTKITRGRY